METCEREAALLEALASGEVDSELALHAEGCEACRETRLVWAFLREEQARPDLADRPVPAPGLIWWRAQLAARRTAISRAERPVRLMHWAAGVAAAVSVPVVTGWMYGSHAALVAGAAVLVVLAIPAGGLLYYWKRG